MSRSEGPHEQRTKTLDMVGLYSHQEAQPGSSRLPSLAPNQARTGIPSTQKAPGSVCVSSLKTKKLGGQSDGTVGRGLALHTALSGFDSIWNPKGLP